MASVYAIQGQLELLYVLKSYPDLWIILVCAKLQS